VSLTGRFVDTQAGRVFVYRAGLTARSRREPRPPLVMLHGVLYSHYVFRHLLPLVAEEHEVLAIDLPGFGESDRPAPSRYAYDLPAFAATVAEVLDLVGVPRAIAFGHSLGGGVALTLAARRPERVAALIAVSPTIYPYPLPLPADLKLLFTKVGSFWWHHLLTPRDLRRAMRARNVRDPSLITDEHVDYVWARLNRSGGREAAYATLQMLQRLGNNTADPGRVRAPTLLVWPEEDRVVPLPSGKRLARALPGAELRVVPAAGHDVAIERPDELWRQVRPFLDRVFADDAEAEPARSVL
jgi:pimeloyl-ACP methyl ester carboxylesterase